MNRGRKENKTQLPWELWLACPVKTRTEGLCVRKLPIKPGDSRGFLEVTVTQWCFCQRGTKGQMMSPCAGLRGRLCLLGWSSAVSQYLFNREEAMKRLLLSHPFLKAGKEALFQNSLLVFRGGQY